MSETSDEEKRRLLRERRAAKFAKGGASNRLNKIVGGNSSLAAVESPLEKSKVVPETPSAISPDNADDPDIMDISELSDPLNNTTSPISPTPQDIDQMLANMFQGAPKVGSANDQFNDELLKNLFGGNSSNIGNPFGGATGDAKDPFSALMAGLGGSTPGDQTPMTPGLSEEELKNQQLLKNYTKYQKDQLTFRFWLTRFVGLSVLLFTTVIRPEIYTSSFQPVRFETAVSSPFYMLFLSFELVVLSSYYILISRRGDEFHHDSFIVKILNFASIIPFVNQYRGTVMSLVKYQQLLMMFVGDLGFVVLVLGLLSFLGN